MKIVRLSLENFKGTRQASFDFSGQSASIYGANETGKTTVFDAITWLLFGQPSRGDSKNFSPKTITPEGEAHGLDHAVEAVWENDDGSQFTLRRVFHEVYKQVRGQANSTFAGHTTDYYKDGVPLKESEYQDLMKTAFGSIENMRLLTMPDYFPSRLEWKQRRELLLRICGDVSDTMVVASNASLEGIYTYLRKPGSTESTYSIDEYKAIAKKRMADINTELKGMAARIDEATRAIPELPTNTTREAECSRIHSLQEAIAEHEMQKRSGSEASAIEAARSTVLKKNNDMELARQRFILAESERLRADRDKLRNAEQDLLDVEQKKRNCSASIAESERQIASMSKKRETLSQEFAALMAEEFAGDTICPTCKQALPESSVEAAKAAFNLSKSQRAEAINARGKLECSKDAIATAEKIAEIQKSDLLQYTETQDKLQKQIDSLKASMPRERLFEDTDEYRQFMQEITDLTAQQNDIRTVMRTNAASIDAQISDLRQQMQVLERNVAAFDTAKRQRERVKELTEREKELSIQYELAEKGLSLCEAFTRAKVSMLNNRINSHFDSVRFILFEEQQNGGLRECCDVAIPAADGSLIPYQDANTAARLNAGLEIISVLEQHLGFALPVVVDNAESVTNIKEKGIEQLIKLVVSPADRQLRLEVVA